MTWFVGFSVDDRPVRALLCYRSLITLFSRGNFSVLIINICPLDRLYTYKNSKWKIPFFLFSCLTFYVIFYKSSRRFRQLSSRHRRRFLDRSKLWRQLLEKDSKSNSTKFNNGYYLVRYVIAPAELNIANIVPILFLQRIHTCSFSRILGNSIIVSMSFFVARSIAKEGKVRGRNRKKYSAKARIDFQHSRTLFLLYPGALGVGRILYRRVHKSTEFTGCIENRVAVTLF